MKTLKNLDELALEIEDRNFTSITQWKEKNRAPVIGCFPVYSPVEIFHSAGMLPIGIFGAGTSLEINYADSRFQSFVCSIAKTTLEMGLTEKLRHIDGLFFSSICDVARNLSYVFKRNFKDKYIAYMHLPQNKLMEASFDYFTAELERIKEGVENFFHVTITKECLNNSIEAYNRVRAIAREIYAYRAERPENVPARELYAVMRASTLMPPEDAQRLLKNFKQEISRRNEKVKDKIRVIIEGAFCEQPPLDYMTVLEAAGCYIIDDDLTLGWRFLREDVPVTDDPLRSLAESVLSRCNYCSIRHDPANPRTERLLEKVRKLDADAVIISPAKFCEPALFDYVLFRRTFEQENIPHLFIEFEEKMWTFEKVRNEVETFAESLLFD